MSADNSAIPSRAFDARSSNFGSSIIIVRGSDAFEFRDSEQFVWSACDGATSVSEIAEGLAKKYGIDGETALGDVKIFLGELADAGLVEY